ncbi:Fank1 [Symbiodinium natans]|uniref:Fank1 protein n=1 Tax=Symbiodinium natans TaxID=878477 RepID=A0A812U2W2_9DINO|nr:Fank1 [Symbiodinium natans]
MDVQLVVLSFCSLDQQQELDLKIAARTGNVLEVEKMLEHPFDPNVLLHEACWAGQEGVALLLLEAKAEVNLSNSCGQSPLHLATLQGHPALVHLLLDKAADASLADMKGKTAVHLARDRDPRDRDTNSTILRLLEEGSGGRRIRTTASAGSARVSSPSRRGGARRGP